MNEKATIELAGSAWTLIGFEIDTGVIEASTNAPATLTFSTADEQANRISGSGGCNRYTGSYTLADNRLRIGPLASTRMMCDPVRMEQEDRFFQALSTAERCEISRQGELFIQYQFKPTDLEEEQGDPFDSLLIPRHTRSRSTGSPL